jgi:hypothetical protein
MRVRMQIEAVAHRHAKLSTFVKASAHGRG